MKLKVTGTIAMFATRSELEMLNPTAVTALPMYPDGVLADGKGS